MADGTARESGESPTETQEGDGQGAFRMSGVGKHALIYGGGVMINKAVSFFMLPVYTRFLTPADYGVMALIEMTLDVISIFAGAQLAQGIFRYYYKTEDPEERHRVVSTAMLGLSLSYAVVAAIVFGGATFASTMVFRTPEYADLFRLAAGRLLFQSFILTPLSFARVRDFSKIFVAAQAAKLLLNVTLNVVFLVYFGWGVRSMFVSGLISSAILGTTLAIWLTRRVGIAFDRRIVRDLARYGIPLIGMELATFVATFSDRFFIQAVADESAVGIYNLAYSFGFLLATVGTYPFEQVWAPKRFDIARRPDRNELLARGFVYLNLSVLTVGFAMALFAHDIINLMTTPAFHPAARLIPVILVAYVFQAWAGTQDVGILVSEKTEYLTVANWIAAGVAVVCYALMIPRWKGEGAAAATVLAFGTRWGLTYLYSQRLWRVEYAWGPVLRLLGLIGGLLVVSQLWQPPHIVVSIGYHMVLSVAYLVGIWHLGVLRPSEQEMVRGLVATLRKRWRARR